MAEVDGFGVHSEGRLARLAYGLGLEGEGKWNQRQPTAVRPVVEKPALASIFYLKKKKKRKKEKTK